LKGGSSRRKRYLFLHGVTAVGILVNPLENSGGRNMKKLSVLAVALFVATLGIPVFAYGQPLEMKQDEQKPKLSDIKGTVKADGDKITFVTMPKENPGTSSILRP
jgi:hypothetical protein